MDSKSSSKGKSISTSTPSFSFRYNAEDEEVEQVYSPVSEPETSKIDETLISALSTNGKEEPKSKDSSPLLPKSGKRAGSLEDSGSPEPWRLFTEIKGRITKTVEEKIEEMKNDRIKLKNKKKLMNTSSLSDSEERSEASSSIKEVSDKSLSERHIADSDLGDISDTSLTPDRATPIVTDLDVSENTPSREITTHLSMTPKKHGSPPRTPASEKSLHFTKKIKAKSRNKIEMGVEAVEETAGLEEGRNAPINNMPSDNQISTLKQNVSSRAVCYFALLLLYVFVNIPPLLFGVIVGGLLSLQFREWLDACFQWFSGSYDEAGRSNELQKAQNKEIISSQLTQSSDQTYEGWMNEFCYEYQPEIYHVTQTETVYVSLEGSILKLASPRQKISKRAIWNEPKYKLRFDRERTYEISGCTVILLPDKLAHKRIWSKKYPICIILKPDSHMGTRYRERGAYTLDIVSYKDRGKKNEEQDTQDKNVDDATKESEGKKENSPSDEEGEVTFYSEDEEDEDGLSNDYVKIPTSIINKSNIYLFARTDREKDIWFRRLLAATKCKVEIESEESVESIADNNSEKAEKESVEKENNSSETTPLQHYYLLMNNLLGRKVSYQSLDESIDISEEDEGFVWFNVLLGRILFDTMHDPYWIKQIQEKIQRKLSAIKVPPFMEELLVSQVELSNSIPMIEKSGQPQFNEDGVWLDFDMIYKGTFKMAIDTKINIMKLKNLKLEEAMSKDGNESPELEKPMSKSAIFDSEVEDSAESSCSDIDPDDPNPFPTHSRNTSQKVLKMVDKIASSKYFQQVTDNKYVKKALEGVSNTTISLVVEVKSLVGTVVFNFPPPPSDRLWYGFKPNTKLILSAKPRVGQRGINMAYITNYIEKKLLHEFEKLLVMPNMDDLIIPIMNKNKPS